METNEPSAIGVFENLESAEKTIRELRSAGFSSDEIGIIGHIASEQPLATPPELNAPEDNVMKGVGKGGIWGAAIGTLVIVVIPGLAWVSEMGRWFEIVGGAVLGAAAGGAMFAFGSLFFTRSKTRFYAKELEKGRFIVTVKNPSRKEEAVTLLRRQGVFAEKKSNP